MMKNDVAIQTPPRGWAILAFLGPGIVWTSELIGSGEVILTTRNGAILGTVVLWAILIGIFLKCWIGISGARYTVCTGESMIDMFARIPGPRNWVVWTVMVIQFFSALIAMGSLATAAGIFLHSLIPVPPHIAGWLISVVALIAAWSGEFKILKTIMTSLIALMCMGVIYVAAVVFPPVADLFRGLLFIVPDVPGWAIQNAGVSANPWNEILPLIGWAAGGFASQVWYTYWVLGEGYGMARGRGYGKPADVDRLKRLNREDAVKIKGWTRVVYADASVAVLLTTLLTVCFLIAGAGVLRPQELAPSGPDVAVTLANIFASQWGRFGALLFMVSGTAALAGTLMVQLAGWPRLLADTTRICIPTFSELFPWKTQFRLFLVFFFLTNMIIVVVFGFQPVVLVKTSAVLDGLLLTPLQALWMAVGLYYVMPKMFTKEVHQIIKPHWVFALFLGVAVLVFGYFFLFQIPAIL
jgi:Mn2+/Fe2+ NRAMP family transporter